MKHHTPTSRNLSGALIGACALLLASPQFAAAQDAFPDKTITIVQPLAAGGPTDVIGRIVAKGMTAALGKPVVVENRTGASGQIAYEYVLSQKADGYTLIHASLGITAIHLTNPTFKADVTTAFAPISMIEDRPVLFAATTSKPYKNFAELIDYARKNPGTLNYAAGGTSDAIGAAWLFQLAGIKGELVRFQGGAPAVTATAAGTTDLTLTFMAQIKGHVDSGRLRPIAVTGPKRAASMPNVPAVAEMFPGYAWTSFTGLLAPAGTPRPVIDKLNQAVRKSLEDAEVKKLLEAQDTVPTPSTPEEYGQYIARIRSTFTRIAQEAKVVM
jgi:tripartite-type tricarboxylate transporter receptor subunit TctC